MADAHGVLAACEALGVSRATFYRERKTKGPSGQRPTPKRALSEEERNAVMAVCHSEEFVDRPPATIQATLADRGVYLCSTRMGDDTVWSASATTTPVHGVALNRAYS